jgi:hypothetical protein
MAMRYLRWFTFAALVLSAAPALAKDGKSQADALLSFVVGDYVIVGREPDGGATYAGTASVEPRTGGLFLKRRRGEHEVTAFGRLEVPSPPDEGHVLRFRWDDPEPVLMTCLVGADLDNYPRLTCTWLHEGSQPTQPGLEAMFPTTGRANERKP